MTVTVLSSASGILPLSSPQGKALLELACLCTDCRETSSGYLGDPTETALAEAPLVPEKSWKAGSPGGGNPLQFLPQTNDHRAPAS